MFHICANEFLDSNSNKQLLAKYQLIRNSPQISQTNKNRNFKSIIGNWSTNVNIVWPGLDLLFIFIYLENKRWDFSFLPIFDGVIMDWHPIFWVVDAGVAGIHHDCVIFAFYRRDLFVKNIITSFYWFHLNNYTPYENKCFNPRNQIHRVEFVCVQMRHAIGAVFTRVKYASTPRNCWTRYPPRYSNGWAEFCSEPMKPLVNKLNHAHWLRILFNLCPIEGFHVTSLQQNLPSHAAHSGHVGSHKIWPNSLLLKLHKA